MAVHENRRTLCLRQENVRGRPARQEVQREVRLPAGVHHERVHRAEETLRHHESGREPRL